MAHRQVFLLQHALEQAVEASPEAPAASFVGKALSYGELWTRSGRLASALAELGVRRGDRVGIYQRKSLLSPVAIHGILRAGAAYVPLDPTAPPTRVAHVVRDCGIRQVVTDPSMRSARAALAAEGLSMDAWVGATEDEPSGGATVLPWADVDSFSIDPPAVTLTEHDFAYILYTSGSTGVPKGILHSHRSALSFAEVAASAYGLERSDRVSNHAPLHFDLSTLDYFATVVAGATVVIIPEAYTKLAASLAQLMESERLTVLYCVPLALVQLHTHGALEKRNLSTLRWILFGGEPMPMKHLRGLMEALPHVRFANVYGPTEVNGCTHYPIPGLPDESVSALPIGGLYPNARSLVLDRAEKPVERGQEGELLISSATRMLGYWGRPEQTAAATFRKEIAPGLFESYHRTGDLVREDPPGMFQFLGRLDRQVKVRGYRVELDDVEANLVSHPEVEEAAVFSVLDAEGGRRVEAAVRLRPGSVTDGRSLREYLAQRLPPYALPGETRVLETFPRTSTGKIDRRALEDLCSEASRFEESSPGEPSGQESSSQEPARKDRDEQP